jgi:5-methylcytosine-specific restriction endonuclease McrA
VLCWKLKNTVMRRGGGVHDAMCCGRSPRCCAVPDAYHRASWRRARIEVLAEASVCAIGLPGCTTVATAVDHAVSLSMGGDSRPENLRPCCKHCNSVLAARQTNAKRRAAKVGRRSRDW